MKRNFTRILAAFALLVGLTFPMGVWGQTRESETITFADLGLENGVQYTDPFGTNISVTFAGGDNDGKYYTTGSGIRTYGDGTITITANDNTVTAISTTFSGVSNAPASTDVWSCNGTTTNSTSGVNASWSGSATEVVMTRPSGSGHWRMQAITVTYTAGGSTPTTYNVTVNQTTGGTIAANPTQATAGTTITLTATPAEGYSFDSWSITPNTVEINNNQFTMPASDVTVSAQWTENTTPTPEGETATLNIQAYAEANSWENGVKYTTATVAPVTFTANGGGNTGKYYTSGEEWRFYQTESASITISVAEGYTLVSVKPTYNVTNNGVLKNGDVTIESGTTVNASGTSVTFTVGNSGSATNGQVKFTNIDVVYVSDGGTQTASDLTITNESTNLTFDLYNNTTAQVISYTTSSTGAITITPAESDYFSYVHDAAAKTITVTPTAVTPSAQTVTISQAADDDYYAGTATFTVTVANSDPNLPGTENNPYTVAQARAAIDAGTGTQGVYATGIVSAIPTAYNSTYGNVTFNMVDEEGDEVFLQAYRCGGDEAANVAVGDVAVVYGNLTKYGSTYEFGQGCQLISLTSSGIPSITADNVNIAADVTSGSIAYTINNPATNGTMAAETSSDWLTLGVGFDSPIAFTCTANTATSPRTATVTLTYTYNTNQTVTKEVTINQAAYVAPFEPVLYTRATEIVSGQHYIIVGFDNEDHNNAYAMGEQKTNNRAAVLISEDGTTATVTTADVHEVVITALEGEDNGYYTIEDGGYLYAASSSANQLKTKNDLDVNGKWKITIENGEFSIAADKSDNRNVMQFNYASNNQLFSCYATASQKPVYLYVKSDEAPSSYTLNVTGYGENEGGYVLIASPINNVNPATIEGMTAGDFDLYYFDQAASDGLEWINYEAGAFNLVSGKGYLYANSANVTLTFAGKPYTGDGQVPVIAGYNLVGNPYAVAANLSVPYYRLNASGSELSASTESSAVNAMEGVFVQATEAGSVTFTTSNSGNGKSNAVVMNLSRNRGTAIDNAIVRFDEGQQLPKFQLFENSTKLYIPQGNKDFAIVRSAAQGEMPVSFRASENGTYTIAVEAENVEMNYLHLIDNMTGADVDLLATPNYTFEARTNDYTSRFRLVFSANGIDEQTAEAFAFFNGTSWTVSNTGDATLQVVDITGRIVSSETINGNATVSLNQPAGIYMLRLVNGNDVKVQKVVVR